MKKYRNHLFKTSLYFIPLIVALLLIIILLKQISLYSKLVQLYHALFPLFGGVIIAFLLQPIIDRLTPHMKRKTAVVLVYVCILFLGFLLLLLFVPILYRQIVDFVSLLPDWMEKIQHFLNQHHMISERIANYQDHFMEEGTLMVIDSLRSFFGTTMNYAIAYITAFFISIDMDFFKHIVKRLYHDNHKLINFYKTMSNIIFQYLIGTILDLAFVSIVSAVILYAADFPNALLYAMILALSNLFPYIGPTVGLVFVIVVGVLSYDQIPYMTILLLWISQQIESNFVQPMIFNKTMDVRPILTFAALFVAEALFGIPGILLSPIFASIVQITFRSYLFTKSKDSVGKWEDIWYDFDDVMKEMPLPPEA